MISSKNLLFLLLAVGWLVGLASQFHSARTLLAYLVLSALMVAFAALRWPRREVRAARIKPRHPDDKS